MKPVEQSRKSQSYVSKKEDEWITEKTYDAQENYAARPLPYACFERPHSCSHTRAISATQSATP
jgi:hypothetical protein